MVSKLTEKSVIFQILKYQSYREFFKNFEQLQKDSFFETNALFQNLSASIVVLKLTKKSVIFQIAKYQCYLKFFKNFQFNVAFLGNYLITSKFLGRDHFSPTPIRPCIKGVQKTLTCILNVPLILTTTFFLS